MLTPQAVGTLLKEMVRRAIEAIQAQQFTFEAEAKSTSYSDRDIVTSADVAAQEIYLHLIETCLPGVGIIAEEEELRVPPSGTDLYVTVDPLDGTRAFTRRQSHGVGTMVAMLRGNEVISAYVGDIMTREIYGYRPGSTRVHRVSQYNIGTVLEERSDRPLQSRYLLLRDEPQNFSAFAHELFFDPDSRIMRSFEITSGSVGIQFSRLWKDEIGAILMAPARVTPWDFNPVVGISRMLGYEFVELDEGRLRVCDVGAIYDFTTFPHEMLVVHRSRLPELERITARS